MPTIPDLVIIADDLTGALDAAAPLSVMGSGLVAATRPEATARALAAGAAVVTVSTRTRETDPMQAAARVAEVVAMLPPGLRVIKKIDSRLKGNIEAELEPLGDRPLLVLPAIPDMGRTVRNGAVEGFGLEEPLPVRPVLGRCAGRAMVPDVITHADLVSELAAAPADAVLVGARGLTLALAEVMGLKTPPAMPTELLAPACFVVGSADPITLAQAEALRHAVPGLLHVRAPGGHAPTVPTRSWQQPPVTLIQITSGAESRPDRVTAAFAASARPWLDRARSVLLTGGATAEAVFDALGIDLLTIAGEILPGLPLCNARMRTFVTKSGGFGPPDVFVRLAPRSTMAAV